MNRRTFMQWIGLVPVVVALPVLAKQNDLPSVADEETYCGATSGCGSQGATGPQGSHGCQGGQGGYFSFGSAIAYEVGDTVQCISHPYVGNYVIADRRDGPGVICGPPGSCAPRRYEYDAVRVWW